MRISNLGFILSSIPTMSFVIFSAFALAGGELTSRRVFTTLALVRFIRMTVMIYLVHCVFMLSECGVAVNRLSVRVHLYNMLAVLWPESLVGIKFGGFIKMAA